MLTLGCQEEATRIPLLADVKVSDTYARILRFRSTADAAAVRCEHLSRLQIHLYARFPTWTNETATSWHAEAADFHQELEARPMSASLVKGQVTQQNLVRGPSPRPIGGVMRSSSCVPSRLINETISIVK